MKKLMPLLSISSILFTSCSDSVSNSNKNSKKVVIPGVAFQYSDTPRAAYELGEIDELLVSSIDEKSLTNELQREIFADLKEGKVDFEKVVNASLKLNLERRHSDFSYEAVLNRIDKINEKVNTNDAFEFKNNFEQQLEDILGSSIKYSMSNPSVANMLFDKKMQCISGTMTYLVARTKDHNADFIHKDYQVVIHTAGHIQPGIVVQDKNNDWHLYGIETTTEGKSLVYFGLASDQDPSQVRVLNALDFLLIDVFQKNLTQRKELITEAYERTEREFGFYAPVISEINIEDEPEEVEEIIIEEVEQEIVEEVETVVEADSKALPKVGTCKSDEELKKKINEHLKSIRSQERGQIVLADNFANAQLTEKLKEYIAYDLKFGNRSMIPSGKLEEPAKRPVLKNISKKLSDVVDDVLLSKESKEVLGNIEDSERRNIIEEVVRSSEDLLQQRAEQIRDISLQMIDRVNFNSQNYNGLLNDLRELERSQLAEARKEVREKAQKVLSQVIVVVDEIEVEKPEVVKEKSFSETMKESIENSMKQMKKETQEKLKIEMLHASKEQVEQLQKYKYNAKDIFAFGELREVMESDRPILDKRVFFSTSEIKSESTKAIEFKLPSEIKKERIEHFTKLELEKKEEKPVFKGTGLTLEEIKELEENQYYEEEAPYGNEVVEGESKVSKIYEN